jgi:uncharacterized membrane protein YkgB
MGEIKIQTGVAILILIIVSLILLMWIGGWECKNDSGCGEDEICTVNHICYKPEISEKTIYITENKYTAASFILGICVIISAIILKKKNFKFSKNK